MASRFNRTKEKTERARALRKVVSKSEARLWLYLRANALGAPFRRQHPIGPYFADYYCAPLKLAVEIDGDGHDKVYDARRDAFFAAQGIDTLRFSAAEELEGVVCAIREAVRNRLLLRDLEE